MVAGELLGLVPDLAPQLSVPVVLSLVLGGCDAQDVVGGQVGFTTPRSQGDASDKDAILGLDDDLVANPKVEVAGVAELRDPLAGDADVYEPREDSSIFCRLRDSATSNIASGETLYVSFPPSSPKTPAAPAQSAPGLSATRARISAILSALTASSGAPVATTAASR